MARGTDLVLWSQDRDIIARVVWPSRVRRTTGLMLVVHGFGNNRFQYAEMMYDFAHRMDVVCVSPEYRDSGRDSGMGVRGARRPYDSSHKQVIDSLNSFRRGALEFPQIDHSRRFVWGGSQGGHIALLATIFAPNTFVLTMDLCGKVHPFKEKDTGASLEDSEKLIRSADVFASRIRNRCSSATGRPTTSSRSRNPAEWRGRLRKPASSTTPSTSKEETTSSGL